MRLEQLRYLVEIANSGSISKASRNLHISYQSLQKTLNNIENNLGIIIFERTAHGVQLTPEGALVKTFAQDVINRKEQFEREIEELRANKPSTNPKNEILNCEVATTIGELVFTKVLPEFTKKFPNVSLRIRECEASKITDHILNNECSFGITTWNRGQDPKSLKFDKPNYLERFLFEDNVFATFSTNHPLNQFKSLSFRTILKYPLAVYLVDDIESHTLYQFLSKRFPNAKIHISTNNLQILEQQIQHGYAVGITPGNFLKYSPFYNDKNKVRSVKIKDALPQIISALVVPSYYDSNKEEIDALLNLIISFGTK